MPKIKISQILKTTEKVSSKGAKYNIYTILNEKNECIQMTAFDKSIPSVVVGAELECDAKDYQGEMQYTVKSGFGGGSGFKGGFTQKKITDKQFCEIMTRAREYSKHLAGDNWISIYTGVLTEAFKYLEVKNENN